MINGGSRCAGGCGCPPDPQIPLNNNSNNNRTFQNNLQQQHHLLDWQPATTMKKPFTTTTSTNCEEPSSLQSPRQLLPALVFLLTFATVLSVLIIYMDTTEIRHQQFRLNMTRDYELVGVSQDDPELINYVRDIYLRRYSNAQFTANGHPLQRWDYHGRQELTPRMAQFIAEDLLRGKRGGVFVQSMPGANERLLTGQWLAGGAQWTGLIIEPELRKYFEFRKELAPQKGVEVVHACVSPTEYPREVHLERELEREAVDDDDDSVDDVKINSLHGSDEDEDSGELEAGRVKCFSLFTILLATNRTAVDLLSVGVRGHQLQILQTLPFDRVKIGVISLHFANGENTPAVVGNVSQFLYERGFEFARKMENSYLYQAIAKERLQERQQQMRVENEGGE